MVNKRKIYDNASGSQYQFDIANDGSRYFVVWTDDRSGYPDIYATFIDSTGIVYDSLGMSLVNAKWYQSDPSASFDGEKYLVVYREHGYLWNHDLYGMFINRNGLVNDSIGFSINTHSGVQGYPASVFGNGIHLIVWTDSRSGLDIYGTRVTPSGVVLEYDGIAINRAYGEQKNAAVAFDGDNFFIVWEDRRNDDSNADIYGTFVSPAGIVLDTVGILIAGDSQSSEREPDVAFDGQNYMVCWKKYLDNGEFVIQDVRVSTIGIVIDTPQSVISSSRPKLKPKISHGVNNFLITWGEFIYPMWNIVAKIIDLQGVPIDTAAINITDNWAEYYYSGSAVSCINGRYLICWDDNRKNDCDLYCTTINSNGIINDTIGRCAAYSASAQSYPLACYGGSNVLVLWHDGKPTPKILYTRMTTSGTVLDTLGSILLEDALPVGSLCISSDGDKYFVGWENTLSNDIYGLRIDHDGLLLDTTPIMLSSGPDSQKYCDVTSDSINFFAVWSEKRADSSLIYGTRISSSGVILDSTGIRIAYLPYAGYTIENVSGVGVTFYGNSYLVVYAKSYLSSYEPPIWYRDVYAGRVSPSGIVIDTVPITISYHEEATSMNHFELPCLDSIINICGGSYPWGRVLCKRIDTSGVVLDSNWMHTGETQYGWSASSMNTYFLTVWSQFPDLKDEIYGKRMNFSGYVIDTTTFLVSSRINQRGPYIIEIPNSNPQEALLFYDDYAPRPYSTRRIFAELLSDLAIEQVFKPGNWGNKNFSIIPNPVTNECQILYLIDNDNFVTINIYNLLGRKVTTLLSKKLKAGSYIYRLMTKDMPNGMYFCEVKVGNRSAIHKIIVIK